MNIKEYFNMDDPAYSEYEIYRWFKHTTQWKLTILRIRVHELLYLTVPAIYSLIFFRWIFKYPQDLIWLYKPRSDLLISEKVLKLVQRTSVLH